MVSVLAIARGVGGLSDTVCKDIKIVAWTMAQEQLAARIVTDAGPEQADIPERVGVKP